MSEARFHLPFERPTAGPGPWAVESFLVPQSVAARLRALSGGNDESTALLAALQILLFRYTGHDGVPVVVAGSPARLVTSDVHAAVAGGDVVQDVREAVQTAPVLESWTSCRETSVAFTGIGTVEPPTSLDSSGDITLHLSFVRDHRLRGSVLYRRQAFSATEVERLVGHFLSLADQLASRPEAPVAALRLLSDAEESRVRRDWNSTSLDYARDRLVHEVVAERVAATPEAVAVTSSGRDRTYAELDERARALAGSLRQAGVGRGDVVALSAERSFDMVSAVLGILYTGAAYLPLDPSYPADRLAYMVEDSGATVLVAQRSVLPSLPSTLLEGTTVILCDDVLGAAASPEAPGSEVPPSPESPAYVIYTSGSTGRPKGVVVPHRAVGNLFSAIRSRTGIGPDDVVLGLSPLSFDISVLELLLTLMVGGRVHLVDRTLATDGRALAAEIDRGRATVVQATPATFRMLVAAGWRGHRGLTLISGGEALAPDLAEALLHRCRRLWNGYGPTEATVYSLFEPIAREVPVAIGTPLANTRAYVLDEHLNPLPVGVPGELYLAGDGLAHGYLGRPELTAERFVPDPFDPRGGRLYRTGDLTQWTEDGRVEYLGRIDHQVKLRGYRIELGEIEATLRNHPAVREAVAAVVSRVGREPILAAYLELVPGQRVGREELRHSLGGSLPEFMVPTDFLVIDEMPLTPSNKVDRKAVLAMDASALPLPAQPANPPRSALEVVVMSVWLDALGLDDLGVDTPVFDHGANSLTAQFAATALEDVFQMDVPVRTVFERPTIEGQAAYIKAHGRRAGRDASHIAERLLALSGQTMTFDERDVWAEEAVA